MYGEESNDDSGDDDTDENHDQSGETDHGGVGEDLDEVSRGAFGAVPELADGASLLSSGGGGSPLIQAFDMNMSKRSTAETRTNHWLVRTLLSTHLTDAT